MTKPEAKMSAGYALEQLKARLLAARPGDVFAIYHDGNLVLDFTLLGRYRLGRHRRPRKVAS